MSLQHHVKTCSAFACLLVLAAFIPQPAQGTPGLNSTSGTQDLNSTTNNLSGAGVATPAPNAAANQTVNRTTAQAEATADTPALATAAHQSISPGQCRASVCIDPDAGICVHQYANPVCISQQHK
jgi:hypothetical protein